MRLEHAHIIIGLQFLLLGNQPAAHEWMRATYYILSLAFMGCALLEMWETRP